MSKSISSTLAELSSVTVPPPARAAEAGDAVAVLRQHAAAPVRGVAPQPAARAVAPAVDRAAFHVNDERPAGNLHSVAEDGHGHDRVVAGGQGGGLRLSEPGEPLACATTRPRHVNSTCDTVPSPAAAARPIVAADEVSVRLPPLKLIERPWLFTTISCGRIAFRRGLGVVDRHDADLVDAVGKARRVEVERPAAAGQRARRTDQPVHEQLQRADAGGDRAD